MKEAYEGVHRKRQFEIAVQLFKAKGIACEDKERNKAWVMRRFRQFDVPVSVVLNYGKCFEPAAISQFGLVAISYVICLVVWECRIGTVINGQGIMQSAVVREHAGIPDDQNIMVCIAMGYPIEEFDANTVKSSCAPNENVVT